MQQNYELKYLKKVHNNIIKMQTKSITYINNKRKNTPLLKEREKIYFLTKNFMKKKQKQKVKFD